MSLSKKFWNIIGWLILIGVAIYSLKLFCVIELVMGFITLIWIARELESSSHSELPFFMMITWTIGFYFIIEGLCIGLRHIVGNIEKALKYTRDNFKNPIKMFNHWLNSLPYKKAIKQNDEYAKKYYK